MDKYIKKETAIKSLLNDCLGQVSYSREDAADCIFYMDAADVAPARHGRWVPYHDSDFGWDEYGYKCSACNYRVERDEFTFAENFCPLCGAKMDLEG